jgi:TATA-box binding protein (TBP) (component of TFIID and TFIIIB)
MKMAYPAFGKYRGGEFATPCTLACRINIKGVTIVIFKRGLINVLGAKTIADATEALYTALLYLYRKTGFMMRVHDFAVHNMQATLYMNYSIDLPELERNLVCSVYNPSNIGFLKYTIPVEGGSVTFLIYPNGKIVLVKPKNPHQFMDAKRIMVPFLARFAQHPNPRCKLHVKKNSRKKPDTATATDTHTIKEKKKRKTREKVK